MKKLPPNPKIALAGSVNSSKAVLEKLIEHKMNVVTVFGLSPAVSQNVSGYQDLKPIANDAGLRFHHFEKINDDWIQEELIQQQVDIFFVVGLSQLVREKILLAPKYACIGYHPTMLPKGRGRAAVAWIILGKVQPAVTFFEIDKGMDSGDIIFQRPVPLPAFPYAQDVIDALVRQIYTSMDDFLPQLKIGVVKSHKQNQDEATYLGVRKPIDGMIDWTKPSADIFRLIRAVSRPLPGAFTVKNNGKIVIWKAKVANDLPIVGVPGRILRVYQDRFYVQTGDQPLEVLEYDANFSFKPKVGMKLGLNIVQLLNKVYKDE